MIMLEDLLSFGVTLTQVFAFEQLSPVQRSYTPCTRSLILDPGKTTQDFEEDLRALVAKNKHESFWLQSWTSD